MYNNAAQAWNHAFYWQCLRPTAGGGGGEPDGALAEAIDKAFGGTEALRKQFDALALGTFGSGWIWLVQRRWGERRVGKEWVRTWRSRWPVVKSQKKTLTPQK